MCSFKYEIIYFCCFSAVSTWVFMAVQCLQHSRAYVLSFPGGYLYSVTSLNTTCVASLPFWCTEYELLYHARVKVWNNNEARNIEIPWENINTAEVGDA